MEDVSRTASDKGPKTTSQTRHSLEGRQQRTAASSEQIDKQT